MTDRTKLQKEADLYKDLPTKKLKKVIRSYKSLSFSNSDIFNFLYTLVIMVGTAVLISGFNLGLLLVVGLVHYLFFWEYLHKYKKSKIVSDKDKGEIDEIIKILQSELKVRETKNPSI
jgi:hypothetical protein